MPSIPTRRSRAGTPSAHTSRRLGTVWSNTDLYTYFRDQTPIDQAGYSIGLYEVKYPPEMPVTRTVIIGTPAFYVPTSTLGLAPNTRVNVKWVDNPDSIVLVEWPGALHHRQSSCRSMPTCDKTSNQRRDRADGAWIVDARPIVVEALSGVAGDQTATARTARSTDWPLRFNDQIDLIGFKADPLTTTAGSELDLTTYWRVSGHIDTCTPLAMFVHVANDQVGNRGAIRWLEYGPAGTGSWRCDRCSTSASPSSPTRRPAGTSCGPACTRLTRCSAGSPAHQQASRPIDRALADRDRRALRALDTGNKQAICSSVAFVIVIDHCSLLIVH